MLNRSQACAALIICNSVAFAQEASTPPADPAGQGGGSTITAPAITPAPGTGTSETLLPSGLTPPAEPATQELTPAEPEKTDEAAFSLPGGFGYAPLDFTPGQGRFDRKPLTFSTSLQQGYDDNVNSSSGKGGQAPIRGSMSTTLSEGVDILLSQSRFGLSTGANIGGQYYWDRPGQELTGNGGANLLFAYKLTPRAQFSALVNAVYTSQPTLSVVNGLTQSAGKSYLLTNGKFDLLYQWFPRFSTDSTYTINTTFNQDSNLQANDYLVQTFGQSLRYTYSRLVTGVVDARVSQSNYKASISDANTYYMLAGCDVTWTRRLSGSFRTGATIQDSNNSSATAPYLETTVNYNFTKASVLGFDARYGFDDGSYGGQSRKSFRTGVSLNQVLSPRLNGSVGVNYSNSKYSTLGTTNSISGTDDVYSASLGLQYALTQNMSLAANINRLQSAPAQSISKYSKDTYFLTLSYRY